MKTLLVFLFAAGSCAYAQDTAKPNVVYQSAGLIAAAGGKGMSAPVQGAPYSATISNESVQTLTDGNRIVQSNSGATARDSQGRTRQDAPLPAIGNLSAANAPHLVFIMDPVAQASYVLNLTDKTAQKMTVAPSAGGVAAGGPGRVFFTHVVSAAPAGGAPLPPPPMGAVKMLGEEEQAQVSTEDLGTQSMEGLLVTGVRTTHTIPAGEIGNEKPITVVTEVWTSPDLKTIVYSKRSDPRMGEQTFKLTNIVRGEPDAALFRVPADFKVTEGPQNFIYRAHE